MNVSRRDFLNRLSAGAAMATIAPGLRASFAADTTATNDVLIVLFQRGACDWLQMLSPAGDANYIAKRPSIRVQTSGTNAGIGIGTLNGTDLYLSNSAPELKSLYDSGNLAFVHATGLYTADRSHFVCQANMEKGTADADPSQTTGWLARHITSLGVKQPELGVVSSNATNPTSLLGDNSAVAILNSASFNVSGGNTNGNVIRALNKGTSAYQMSATNTLDAIAAVQAGLTTINDTSASAGYTGGALSTPLRSLGRLIKMNIGLSVATVDFGSWDMHNNLVGEFAQRTTEFSRALNAFWTDMADYRSRITLVTMTEFGRRFQENASQGTDHGAASGMLVLSGNVNGGKIYGTWPGLATNQLNNGDLAVTTDYRTVLSEILVTRHGEKNLANVFPTVKYAPLGLMKTSA